jgi:Transposase protein
LSTLKKKDTEIHQLRKSEDEMIRRGDVIKKLKAELEKERNEKERMMTCLQKRFSKAQLDRVFDDKNTNWSNHDYRKSITLLGVSDKAYKLTRELMNLPLPARSAVKNLIANIDMSEGILGGVLDLLSAAGNCMTELECQVSFCFDEAQLSNKKQVTYNSTTDQVQGPHKLMQVAMISGIFSSFSNPVFYKNSCAMTKKLLFEILTAIHEAGFHVRVIVCDLGLDNQKLLRELKVDEKKPFFEHPVTKKKIYVWADPPHCEKLLRNHLIDTGIELDPKSPGRKFASREPLQALVTNSSHMDLPSHPLKQEHLNVQGSERQRCQPARELLDERVAKALEKMACSKDYANTDEGEFFKVKL